MVDEHMFGTRYGTMRVQLFTGAGLRPVAVVTQTGGEGGSLQNRAECYVEEIWRRLCPDEAEPPLFIAHQLLGEKDLGFQQYRLIAAGPYRVERPVRWGPRLSPAELAELVGGPIDPDRGAGYVQREPLEEGKLQFRVTAVIVLPRPDLHGEPRCMPTGTPLRRRLGRQLAPRRHGRDCCWYHKGDWRAASAVAIRALSQIAPGPLEHFDASPDGQVSAPQAIIRAQTFDSWTRTAAESLLRDPIQIDRDVNGSIYVNGRHRSQAMLDAGVRRTLVAYWVWPGDQDSNR
ncbi:hypothetical protein [Rugosimonospora africana]|uniref:hypothetical protein n=1 Tax=Rugosimonospora africana TaxID=556532 RepID=UPI001943733F|nr:hypothetical protein [Rugosimonospora africana]